MRTALRYVLTIVLGLALGVSLAIRSGALGSTVQIGLWTTGRGNDRGTGGRDVDIVLARPGQVTPPARRWSGSTARGASRWSASWSRT